MSIRIDPPANQAFITGRIKLKATVSDAQAPASAKLIFPNLSEFSATSITLNNGNAELIFDPFQNPTNIYKWPLGNYSLAMSNYTNIDNVLQLTIDSISNVTFIDIVDANSVVATGVNSLTPINLTNQVTIHATLPVRYIPTGTVVKLRKYSTVNGLFEDYLTAVSYIVTAEPNDSCSIAVVFNQGGQNPATPYEWTKGLYRLDIIGLSNANSSNFYFVRPPNLGNLPKTVYTTGQSLISMPSAETDYQSLGITGHL